LLTSIPQIDINRTLITIKFEKILINKPFFATGYKYSIPGRFTFGTNGKLFF